MIAERIRLNDRELFRAFGVSVLRNIVERLGGTIEVDWELHTFCVDIAEEHASQCAREIMDAMNRIEGCL